jgi:nitroreductase
MEVTEAIIKRRSIKRYLDIPVEWDKIGAVLDAGRLSPSAGNLQPWKFLVVMNQANRRVIAESCFQQYWMQTAPVHIIICGEFNKMSRFYGVRGERLYAIQSCALAAENMLLEAVNQNLAGCFVSAFDEDMIKNHFKIPDFARPQAIITLGYPGEEIPIPPKYTLNDIVHLEEFGAKIRDFESYLGYNWGREVKRIVKKGKEAIDKVAAKGEEALSKAAENMRRKEDIEEVDEDKDFRYGFR